MGEKTMCTVCMWANNTKACLSSRNMDWLEPMPSSIWVMPRGAKRFAGPAGAENVLEWTSKYGSFALVNYGIGTSDGLNEKGLAASVLWLAESDYGARDKSLPSLGIADWAQYYLDNFETVKEAVAAFETQPYQVVPTMVAGRPTTLHLHISDATGDCAVFEWVDGDLTIYHSPNYAVMTNSPLFSEQIKLIKQYVGFGGDEPLPGSTEAAARFVRAAYYVKDLPQPGSHREALAELLSVLRNVAQPFGVPDPTRPNVSPTRWRTLRDHSNVRYYYESSVNPFPIWLDGMYVDFSETAEPQVLHLENLGELVGELSSHLERHPMPQFEYADPDAEPVAELGSAKVKVVEPADAK